jgi:hypothetical protein
MKKSGKAKKHKKTKPSKKVKKTPKRLAKAHTPHLHHDNGKWKIAKVTGARKGDEITWHPLPDSDLYFQFPPHVFDGDETAHIPIGGGPLTRKVKTGKAGRYYYSLFVDKDKSHAESDSPPTIIIM